MVFQHHLRLAWYQPHRLPVEITIARRRVGQRLAELDGVATCLDRPFPWVDDLVQLHKIILPVVLAKRSDADFDKRTGGLGLIPSQGRSIGLELLHRTRIRSAG